VIFFESLRESIYIDLPLYERITMKKLLFGLMIAGLVATGCAHKQTIQNGPQAGQESPSASKSQAAQNENSNTTQGGVTSKNLSGAEVQKTSEEAGTKIPDIHFDFDQYNLHADARPVLKEVAGILLKHDGMKVVIEGNCDEKGTVEYNMALGDRRAGEAKTALVALGVPANRIETVSYGKEKPVCHESNERCWKQNRRDHFVLSQAGS
jgi:peptidoglycan-associated lipoprotein